MSPEVKSIMRVLCGETRWQIWWAVRQEQMTYKDAAEAFGKTAKKAHQYIYEVDAIIKKIRAANEDSSI